MPNRRYSITGDALVHELTRTETMVRVGLAIPW